MDCDHDIEVTGEHGSGTQRRQGGMCRHCDRVFDRAEDGPWEPVED